MIIDTAFDATKCVIINRGSSSLFLPFLHDPFCDAARRALRSQAEVAKLKDQSRDFEGYARFLYVAQDP